MSGQAGPRPAHRHAYGVNFPAIASHDQTLPGEPWHVCSVTASPAPCVAVKAAVGRKERAPYRARADNESY